MGDHTAVIVSASCTGDRPILERRELDDVAARFANGLKADAEAARDDSESKSPGTKGEVWRRILLEDRVVTPKQLEGIRKNAEDLKQLLGNSGQYMVVMIPQGPEKLPSLEEVKRLYGKPDRVDTTGKDDSYFYGKIILQTEKGSMNIVGIGAPFNWFLEGLKKKAAQ